MCCKTGRAAKCLLGFAGRCAILQQKHLYPAWADTRQELLSCLLPPVLQMVGVKWLKTSRFCNSLFRSTFYTLRPINSPSPAQLFLFFWRILVEFLSITLLQTYALSFSIWTALEQHFLSQHLLWPHRGQKSPE